MLQAQLEGGLGIILISQAEPCLESLEYGPARSWDRTGPGALGLPGVLTLILAVAVW